MNPQIACALGRVLRTKFEGPIAIVRDTRESGEDILRALSAGIGSHSYDYGVMPTPALSVILQETGAQIGVAITASHNPWQDNGLKVLGHDGAKLSVLVEEDIDSSIDGALGVVPAGVAAIESDFSNAYLEAQIRAIGDVSTLRGQRIALDAAHGAAFETGPRLLAAIGVEAVCLGVRPDGQNINRARGAMHPEALQEAVLAHNCRAGIALDGDADRCVLVDERGQVVHGDALLLMLARPPGLVGTVMTNSALERALETQGIGFSRAAVGDRNVQLEMKQRGWHVGGEPSGHVLLSDALPTGDGLVSALRVLATGPGLQERLDGFQLMPSAQRGIRVRSKPPLAQLEELQKLLQEAERSLEGRVLLRYSGTEPKLRVLVEATESDIAQRWCERFEEAVEREGLREVAH